MSTSDSYFDGGLGGLIINGLLAGLLTLFTLARISHRLSFCQSFESTAVCLELWLCSVEFNCRQLATQLTK
jgi:hypothetical protein